LGVSITLVGTLAQARINSPAHAVMQQRRQDNGQMKQKSFASSGFELVTKRTHKRKFLAEMNSVVPWAALVSLIEPHAPSGKTGRPPFAVLTLLRIHFMQQWFVGSGHKIGFA
jgi:hypothetical protein